ncbi:hypothetical protein [Sporosarcina sp. D27]|uniref:hypothetical protein n=1 Tax=Sporosarcina sp. D27 TaxID=1382305 RepID=UPI0004720A0B|nr:hypothetical protein [Sporosarcina sp. D27]
MQASDYINWWEGNKETGLEDVKTTFIALFSKAELLPSIYHPILYKYINNSQIKHWNKEIFTFCKDKIQEFEDQVGMEVMSLTLLSNFHLIIHAFQSILDLEERIMIMERFKGNEELKAKIFSINIYNDLLNTAFSNTLKLFIEFQSLTEGSNLFQKNLTTQIECLASPKKGYQKVTDLADSNIRNAISHGGVKVSGTKMLFSFTKGAKHLQHESTVYDFKDSILKLYDGITAIILAWFGYLCEKNISYNEVYGNNFVHKDTSLFFERLSMSTLHTTCDKIIQLEVENKEEKRNHVNVEFIGIDLDIDSRIFLGMCAAERIFHLRKLSIKDTIMVSFQSSKVASSFFTIDCSVVSDLTNGTIDIENAWKHVVDGKNVLMFPINDEDRNEFEDSFRYYPDIETKDYRLTEIEDISLEDKKRFKAVAYLKRATRPRHVREVVEEIINHIKSLENYGFSSHKVKRGKMEADIIYLVLYKKEVRRGNDRSLFPGNNNFVAQIQYDIDMKFPIRNGLVDSHLKCRREEAIEYNWNPNF